MNFFDVLLILIFISLVIALIYKSITIENYENKENLSNKLTTNESNDNESNDNESNDNKSTNVELDSNESNDIELDSNEISCCKMKEQDNINYIENKIGKIKDMFQFFDEYQKDIKKNINYINLNKNNLNLSIELTKEMNQKYNEEKENINKNE